MAAVSKLHRFRLLYRHSTSKIRKVEDLVRISSLGFRGEALSSIAAVAQVELITKTPEQFTGSRYLIEGGKEVSLAEIGAPNGTTFLVKNLFSMLMTLFTFVAVSKYPLYPTQLSFLGTFTIGTPAFLLAMQPDKSRIEGHFLTNVVLLALPAALTDFILLAVLNVAGNCAGIGHEQLSTMCIMILLAVGMAALIRICMPLDKIRTGICILMASGAVFSVLFLKPLFALYPLSPVWVMVTGILMAAAVPVFAVMCRLVLLQVQRHAKHSKKFRERLGRHFKS